MWLDVWRKGRPKTVLRTLRIRGDQNFVKSLLYDQNLTTREERSATEPIQIGYCGTEPIQIGYCGPIRSRAAIKTEKTPGKMIEESRKHISTSFFSMFFC